MKHSRRLGITIAFILLLGAHFLLSIYSITGKSLTSDEAIHLAGGLSYWDYNDFRVQPENGNLPQRWVALPSLAIQNTPLSTKSIHWRESSAWSLSSAYLFKSDNSSLLQIFLGRSMVAIVSVGLLAVIFFWSRSLWGNKGAFLSLGLAAFSPCLIANGRLMTSDTAFSLVFALNCWFLWILVRCGGFWRTLTAGLLVGICCITKYSAVFLLPYCVVLLAAFGVYHYHRTNEVSSAIRLVSKRGLQLASAAAIALAVIWSAYSWRYEMFNPELPGGSLEVTWEDISELDSGIIDIVFFAKEHQLLPEAYLYGFSHVYKYSRGRSAFFLGEYGVDGWKLFFPAAFSLKTTPATLVALTALFALGLFHTLKAIRQPALRENFWAQLLKIFPLLIGSTIVWYFAITSNLNIGHRHILPLYPFYFILVGGLAHWLTCRSRYALALVSLCGLQLFVALKVFPNYIPYFNFLVGGSDEAHHIFVDSSYDWGQDIPALEKWVQSDEYDSSKPLYLSYFGVHEPLYHNINARYLHSFGIYNTHANVVPLEEGYYCVSATMLQGVYSNLVRPMGQHSQAYEDALVQLGEVIASLNDSVATHQLLDQETKSYWQSRIKLVNIYRFAMLCALLHQKEPIARLNHTLFIFYVSEKEIQEHITGYDFGFPESVSLKEFDRLYLRDR